MAQVDGSGTDETLTSSKPIYLELTWDESPRNSIVVDVLLAVKESASVAQELVPVGTNEKACEARSEVPVALAVSEEPPFVPL